MKDNIIESVERPTPWSLLRNRWKNSVYVDMRRANNTVLRENFLIPMLNAIIQVPEISKFLIKLLPNRSSTRIATNNSYIMEFIILNGYILE